MGVKSYTDKNGNTLWMASLTLRSKLDRQTKIQKKVSGFATQLEALAALKKIRDKADIEVSQKVPVGKSWRYLVDAWELALLRGDLLTRHLTAATVLDYVGPVRKYTEDWMRRPCEIVRGGTKTRWEVRRLTGNIRVSSLKLGPTEMSSVKVS